MEEHPETVLEIDLGALAHNYGVLRSRIRPGTRMLGVVKAFAYGSEAAAIGRKLEALGVDYLGVAFTREGIALRQNGVRAPILVLHPQPDALGQLIEHCLEPSLYNRRILEAFLHLAKKEGQTAYPAHLKFNTGLNRIGFKADELPWIATRLQGEPQVEIRSVFSHLAASDDLGEAAFTNEQLTRFQEIASLSDALLPGSPFKHLLNTSGVLNYPEAQWDMVRTGIGLYGYSNDPETDTLLRPVARLKTRISQIHQVNPGEWVGYNKGYVAEGPRLTATLPIGHADGIGRQYGQEKGCVYLRGRRAPIIGNVCMDMTMVDITGLEAREGDEVVFFGQGFSAEDMARGAGTISYELLAGISQRVPRRITDG
jgi:alanine racemase